MKVKFKALVQFSAIALLAAACSSDPDSAGLEYMPDMYRSPAIEPYVDYGEVRGTIDENKKMEMSARLTPRYTIPYYGTDSETVAMMLPYRRLPGKDFAKSHGLYGAVLSNNADADYEYKLSAMDMNPIKFTSQEQADQVLAAGKALYQANCNHCHGEKGDGQGPMVTAGSFSGAANLKGLTIAEGQMFYSIYYGKGAMGAHASMLNKKEIWTVIHHIRKLQDDTYGKMGADGKFAAAPVAAATPDSIPAKKTK